jgi:hypothetical protein
MWVGKKPLFRWGKIAKVTPEEFDKIVKCLGPLIGLGGQNDSIRFLLQDSF